MFNEKVQNAGLLSTGRGAFMHASSAQIFQRWNLTLTKTIGHILCMSGLEVRIGGGGGG